MPVRTEIELILRTGQVVRYHANPEMIRFMQTDADHTWGVETILWMLHPNPSMSLMKAAHFHDCGELFAGDLLAPFKRAHPEIAAAHAEKEHELAANAGVPQVVLTDEEKRWLSFADRYESFIYMKARGQQKWSPEGVEEIYKQARELGISSKIEGTLNYDF